MSSRVETRQAFIDATIDFYGSEISVLTRDQVHMVVEANQISFPHWFCNQYPTINRAEYDFLAAVQGTNEMREKVKKNAEKRASRKSSPRKMVLTTNFQSEDTSAPEPVPVVTAVSAAMPDTGISIAEIVNMETYIPEVDSTFVPFGYYAKLKKILERKIFLPVFISGLSGVGKTFTTEQICAELGREVIIVPVTIETTEDDLLGGFRLVNGETVWSNGPVIEAMERGALLLLDEIDLASHKIMCLQSIIDGKGVYLKKINKYVKHEDGFNIVATANTKGKGKWKGHFVGTNILNEAFLERFAVLFEQDYPEAVVERKILIANLQKYGIDPKDNDEAKGFIKLLVEWSNQIRTQFDEGNLNEVISTRRLVHIVKYYSVFEDKLDAVKEGTNRFSDDNKEAFTDLYAGMDGDPDLLKKLNENDSNDSETVQVQI